MSPSWRSISPSREEALINLGSSCSARLSDCTPSVSEQVGGDAGAEVQRGVAWIVDERFAKDCRGSVTVASLKRLPPRLCPRGSRRLSV